MLTFLRMILLLQWYRSMSLFLSGTWQRFRDEMLWYPQITITQFRENKNMRRKEREKKCGKMLKLSTTRYRVNDVHYTIFFFKLLQFGIFRVKIRGGNKLHFQIRASQGYSWCIHLDCLTKDKWENWGWNPEASFKICRHVLCVGVWDVNVYLLMLFPISTR